MKQYKIQKYTEVVPFSFCITSNGNLDIILKEMKGTVVDWEFDEFHILATDWALKHNKYYFVLLNQTIIADNGDEIIGFRVLRQWVDEL